MIRFAFSPCPNDTFAYHALVSGLLPDYPFVNASIAPIHQLNQWALERCFPMVKISIAHLPLLLKDYEIIPHTIAWTKDNGPKIVTLNKNQNHEWKDKTIAVPGINTTAFFLLTHFFPWLHKGSSQLNFISYEQVIHSVLKGQCDYGLIINESSYELEKKGLTIVYDLASMWWKRYHTPLPLGGVVIAKHLGQKMIDTLSIALEESVKFAIKNPSQSFDFVQSHAQEKHVEAIRQHIQSYVTSLNHVEYGEGDLEFFMKTVMRNIE